MWQIDILHFHMVVFQHSRNRIYNFETVEGEKKKGKQAKINIPKKARVKRKHRKSCDSTQRC